MVVPTDRDAYLIDLVWGLGMNGFCFCFFLKVVQEFEYGVRIEYHSIWWFPAQMGVFKLGTFKYLVKSHFVVVDA